MRRAISLTNDNINTLSNDEKNRDKILRQQFGFVDSESFDTLNKLMKKRSKVRASQQDIARESLSLENILEAQSSYVNVDPINDRPRTLDGETWNKFLKFRQVYVDMEAKIRNGVRSLTQMKSKSKVLEEADERSRSEIENVLKSLNDFRETRMSRRVNIDVLVHCRQGQVEYLLDSVLPHVDHCLCVERDVIDTINSKITQAATAKVCRNCL